MTIATGVGKKVVYKKETTFGTDPSAGSAQYLRRVTSSLDLSKDTYQSAEIRTDYQVADMRHGMRKVSGDIKDELSCTTFKDFQAAALRAAFVAGTAITTGGVTTISSVAAVGATPGSVHRSSGSFVTNGFLIGDCVVMTGWATTMVGCNSRVYLVTAVSATDMSLIELTGTANSTLVTKSAGDTVTITRTTSKVIVPQTGHTDDSFTIEHVFSDITISERFNGCKVSSVTYDLPATGMATATYSFMGQNAVSGTTGYFTSPTAATTTGTLAAVNGRLTYSNVLIGLVTAANIKIDAGMTTGAVVGQNYTPNVFPGRVKVSGQLSVYFQDHAVADDFWNETTPSLTMAFTSDNNATPSSYMVFNLPKIKLGGATKSDGEQGLVMTVPFTALVNLNGTAGQEQTTISVQDST